MRDGAPPLFLAIPAGGHGSMEPGCSLDPVAQCMELRLRWRGCQVQHKLRPGDLVQARHGMSFLRGDPVMMLWRMLDSADPVDLEILRHAAHSVPHSRPDCIVGHLSDGGEMVIHSVADTEWLEPCTVVVPEG